MGLKHTWGPMFRECVQREMTLQRVCRCKLWEDKRMLLQEGTEMEVKVIPLRNSVREEKREKGDGEWDFFFFFFS